MSDKKEKLTIQNADKDEKVYLNKAIRVYEKEGEPGVDDKPVGYVDISKASTRKFDPNGNPKVFVQRSINVKITTPDSNTPKWVWINGDPSSIGIVNEFIRPSDVEPARKDPSGAEIDSPNSVSAFPHIDKKLNRRYRNQNVVLLGEKEYNCVDFLLKKHYDTLDQQARDNNNGQEIPRKETEAYKHRHEWRMSMTGKELHDGVALERQQFRQERAAKKEKKIADPEP